MFIFNQDMLYSILAIFFFISYIPPNKIHYWINWTIEFLHLKPDICVSTGSFNNNDDENFKPEPNPPPKYEDKYLEDIRKLDKDFVFDEKDLELQRQKFLEMHESIIQLEYFDKLEEIRDKLGEIETKLTKYEGSDDDYCICDDENDEDVYLGETKEERVKLLLEKQNELFQKEKELKQDYGTAEGRELYFKRVQELSRQFVINERLDKLKNNFIMEKTPLGNVLMLYNNKRGSFEFYSDNTIPYRYLEPVSRKYVKTFGCRPIYFDMEEELKNYEKKLEEKECEEKEKEEKRKQEDEENNKNVVIHTEPKKNVFAKFKSYNKEAGTGHVNTAAPPKNSIPNNKVTEATNSEKVLLKENSNRYSYEGKLSNFNFLKKVDRKVIDKKYAMTFADFKRLQEDKKNK